VAVDNDVALDRRQPLARQRGKEFVLTVARFGFLILLWIFVFTVVGDIFPPDERGKWQGIVGMVYAFSSVIGPTTGGWLADNGPLVWPVLNDASRWRWVFFINLPLGIIALVGLLVFLPTEPPILPPAASIRFWTSARGVD